MKRALKVFGWTMLAFVLLCMVCAAVLAFTEWPAHQMAIVDIDGEPIRIGSHWFHHHGTSGDVRAQDGALGAVFAFGGLTLAVSIVAIVALLLMFIVPFAVLLPLLVAALAVCAALVVVAVVVTGAAALVFSPLILIAAVVWLMVRLLRGNRVKRDASNLPGDATIAR